MVVGREQTSTLSLRLPRGLSRAAAAALDALSGGRSPLLVIERSGLTAPDAALELGVNVLLDDARGRLWRATIVRLSARYLTLRLSA